MSKFTYVELFAGIGGVSFGFDANGGNCVMAAEYDPKANTQFAQISYKLLHPGVDLRGDVCEIDEKDVPDHDILSFTTPCQSFSVAGKCLGFEDTRGTLVFEALRIANYKRPKVLFMENVKGLVGHDGGNTLETIVLAMNEIGYTVDFDVLNSKYFGVPQNRERIFIIATRDDLVSHEPWNIVGNNVVAKGKKRIQTIKGVKTFNFDWPSQTEVTTRLRDILEDNVDERFYLSEEKTARLVAQLEERETTKDSDNCEMVGMIDMKGNESIRRVYTPTGVAPTVNTCQGGHREPKIAERESKYRIRKLTPRECFRLQGFSDEAYQTLVDAGISNSQLYKQAGNAVTVNVIDAIGKRLITYLNDIAE